MSADSYVKVVRSHEWLIGIGAVALVTFSVAHHWIDRSADTAIADAKAKIEAAKVQESQNADLAAKAAKSDADYKALVAQVLASNASLAESIAGRNVQTAQQQAQIRVEPLPDVAGKWRSLLSLLPEDIQNGTQPRTLGVSETGARTTVIALEAGQACTANLSDTEQRCQNDEQRIAACDSTVATCQAQVSGLQSQIVSDKQASDAEVKAVRATARRNVIKWSLRSLGAGSVLAVVGMAALGVL